VERGAVVGRAAEHRGQSHERAMAHTHGITCSMSRRGEVLDNAAMEARNSTFKFECGERFETNEIAEAKTFDYIEVFYNQQRRHSAIGYVGPAEFERRFTERQAV
jgi:putative transposase